MHKRDLLFYTNLEYCLKRYLLPYTIVMAPYGIASIVYGSQNDYVEIFGYTTLFVWFGYGLLVTHQPGFVKLIAVLWIFSQWALYNGMHALDMTLTLTCVLLCVIKLYLSRHENMVKVLSAKASA